MGKKHYDQKFCKKWLEDPVLQGWIQPSNEPGQTAFCPYCNRHLSGSKTLMQRHAYNHKHAKNMKNQSGLHKMKDGSESKNQLSKKLKSEKQEIPTFPLKWIDDPLLANWIEPSKDFSHKAYCKCCNCGLYGSKKDMYRHALTSEHQSNFKTMSTDQGDNDFSTHQENNSNPNSRENIKMELLNEREILPSNNPNETERAKIEDDVMEDDDIEHEEVEGDSTVIEEVSELIIATTKPTSKSSFLSRLDKWKKDPKLQQWIEPSSLPDHTAYCTWCKCDLIGNKNLMYQHASSTVHRKNYKQIKKRKIYDQKFNPDWTEDPILCSWIAPSSTKTAFCKKCKRHLQGSKTLMYRHAQNPRHLKSVTEVPTDDSVTSALRMSAFIAEHDLPLNIMNHFPLLVKSVVQQDTVKTIDCKPAKTEFFIKNVLAIDRLNDLSNKLLSTVFSIIVDESADIYSNKSIALVVRYYDEDTHSVEDSFLTIIDVIDTDNLFQAIVDFFESINVPLTNLLGFAADTCNVLLGKYSNLLLKLMNINPFLYVSGCVQNSLQMCVSKAVSKLPDTYEKLCHNIYDYMYYKPQQVAGFQQVYPLFSIEVQDLVKLSNAKWLSMSDVVTKIIENWNSLISYFSICSSDGQDDKAQEILITLTDPMCKLIFLFLNFFLPIVDDLNFEFQGSKYFLNSLLSSIGDKFKMILKFYMKTSYVNETALPDLDPILECQFLLLENMYFGARADALISSLDPTSYEMVLHFKGHCLNFYMEFCSQLLERVDFKDPVIKYLYILNPEIYKSDLYLSIRPLAMLFPNVIESNLLDELESEWWDIKSSSSFKSTEHFFVFWNKVIVEKHADSIFQSGPKYPLMSKFLKAMLCLPHSSESIVNAFTAIRRNNIKTRSKHDSAMMSSLLLIQEKLKGSSSVNFEISDALLCLAKSYTER